MKYVAVMPFVLVCPSALFAAEVTKQPIDTGQILQDLRGQDSSTDMEGDHVVGEKMC